MVEIENEIVVMDAEGGVADEMVTVEVGFENLEILLLFFFSDFRIVKDFNLILVVGDGLINWGEFLVDFSDILLASSKKTEAMAGEENIPGEKSFRGELFLFE